MYEPTRRPYPGRFFWFALAALSMAFAALSVVGCASHGSLAGAKVARAERAVDLPVAQNYRVSVWDYTWFQAAGRPIP